MLHDKLNRLSRDIVRSAGAEKSKDEPERYTLLTDCLNGEIVRQSNGIFVKKTTDLGDTYSHGRMMIMDLDLTTPFNRRHFQRAEPYEPVDGKKLLFFDMETTGLGGTGTIPFLIGFGTVIENGFQVRQYFLPDYPDEEAMLESIRSEIDKDAVIVSYNGKAFDMPILVDRLILQRVERNLQYADHIDLLHTARRIYRRRLRDCTLSNIESEVLDFHRIDDIPGYLVPSIYFNWLNYDDTTELAGVVKHNFFDIVSLFFLMYHFSEVREDPENTLSEPDDIYSVARIIQNDKEHDHVCKLLESFDDITWSHERYDIVLMRAMACKRSGKLDEAVVLWGRIAAGESPEAFWANIELAKYYEHQLKDISKALNCAINAQKICPDRKPFKTGLDKRINRLNRKSST